MKQHPDKARQKPHGKIVIAVIMGIGFENEAARERQVISAVRDVVLSIRFLITFLILTEEVSPFVQILRIKSINILMCDFKSWNLFLGGWKQVICF